MPTFVALLRGINVGKAKRMPMADLRGLLTDLGFSSVATLLNSGNAVFHAGGGTSAQHAKDISAAIAGRFKLEVPVIVKSAKELAAVIAQNPIALEAAEHSRLLVGFVQDSKALSGLKNIQALIVSSERFVVGKGAAYLFCARGILESKAGAALLGKQGSAATTRNWATVLKLGALAG